MASRPQLTPASPQNAKAGPAKPKCLKVSLDAANNKLARVGMTAARRAEAVSLPVYRDTAAVTVTIPGDPQGR